MVAAVVQFRRRLQQELDVSDVAKSFLWILDETAPDQRFNRLRHWSQAGSDVSTAAIVSDIESPANGRRP